MVHGTPHSPIRCCAFLHSTSLFSVRLIGCTVRDVICHQNRACPFCLLLVRRACPRLISCPVISYRAVSRFRTRRQSRLHPCPLFSFARACCPHDILENSKTTRFHVAVAYQCGINDFFLIRPNVSSSIQCFFSRQLNACLPRARSYHEHLEGYRQSHLTWPCNPVRD